MIKLVFLAAFESWVFVHFGLYNTQHESVVYTVHVRIFSSDRTSINIYFYFNILVISGL